MAEETHLHTIDGDLAPLKDCVLVTDMESGDHVTDSGLIIPDDDARDRGIRPRWCTVYATGKDVDYVHEGQRIFVAHARWTRGVRIKYGKPDECVVRMIDPADILLVKD